MLTDAQLLEAAERFGTPLYVYDASVIDRQVARVQEAFAGARVFYAMKANPNLTLLSRLRAQGIGFEVVSLGEFERARRVGAGGDEILVNGPAKTEQEYALGSELGATFIVDRASELDLLPSGAKLLVRVNPGLEVHTHSHLATGEAAAKFGVRLEETVAVIERARALGLSVRGLHLHIGSAITEPGDFGLAFARVAELAAQTGPLEVLDCGGGWGLDADLHGIAQVAREAASAFGAQLWVEPGRFLVAQAGTLLTRVVGQKSTARDFLLLDAGMSELMRPMLYGARHPVRALWEGEARSVDLAGPACESGDLLGRDLALPEYRPGALLAIEEAGAYGASMSSNYLTRPRPAEALFEAGEWRLVRRRQRLEELWEHELPED
ncbi:diaminopimelate decarboxylase [Deinobacterium chartae]|uniref:Diaminopimelate decarboxylase n=1 Tax=Deinobacterium chartae TaxID=521158 RepID=A0A841HXW0_9DEIO|nr:diaminopimelate decarboxylase [Deinobacterium chartae]MBB6097040.1 diaminopimelate decarboxylase [Deinobacterium chartae]